MAARALRELQQELKSAWEQHDANAPGAEICEVPPGRSMNSCLGPRSDNLVATLSFRSAEEVARERLA